MIRQPISLFSVAERRHLNSRGQRPRFEIINNDKPRSGGMMQHLVPPLCGLLFFSPIPWASPTAIQMTSLRDLAFRPPSHHHS